MILSRPNGGRVLIHPEPLDQMLRFRQHALHDTEAGGILMGRLILDSMNIVIDGVTIPGEFDRRKRFRFDRAIDPHQKHLHRQWQISDGTTTYLGEWHTHPEQFPSPSKVDMIDWRRLTRIHRSLLFVIVGIGETEIWEGNFKNCAFKIDHLKKI